MQRRITFHTGLSYSFAHRVCSVRWNFKMLQPTTLCSKKSDAKIQITITTAYLIRIKYPLSSFNYHLSDVNIANFHKIHRIVSEKQLFLKRVGW